MKKTLGVLAAVCWLVFGITGAIRWVAGDGGQLAAEMLRAAPPETSGLPEGEYPGVGTMTAEYLTGKREAFQYAVQGTEVFQEHEAAHMADCRDLIRLDTMVKDHRTNYESGNIDDVMNGNLEGFVTAYLKMQ